MSDLLSSKQETMRLLLIDVRAFLRNDSMDGVYEKGRREGLLDAINAVLTSPDETNGKSGNEPEVIPWDRFQKEAERGLDISVYITSMNAHILNQRDEIARLRPAAESWESYVAAQDRKGEQVETAVALGPREPDNDMVICPNCTSQFVAIPVNVQKRLQPFIGDVRRALFKGEAIHDMWVREITAEMELKGFIESTSQHSERMRQVKSSGEVAP